VSASDGSDDEDVGSGGLCNFIACATLVPTGCWRVTKFCCHTCDSAANLAATRKVSGIDKKYVAFTNLVDGFDSLKRGEVGREIIRRKQDFGVGGSVRVWRDATRMEKKQSLSKLWEDFE
jgi:hypothetical protein